ncbi:MAG: hypothetical protein K2M91_10620 [Lachnospiraceae bacterium]|nr:hypothetical protein [Lachnospiraceae bacterium]
MNCKVVLSAVAGGESGIPTDMRSIHADGMMVVLREITERELKQCIVLWEQSVQTQYKWLCSLP